MKRSEFLVGTITDTSGCSSPKSAVVTPGSTGLSAYERCAKYACSARGTILAIGIFAQQCRVVDGSPANFGMTEDDLLLASKARRCYEAAPGLLVILSIPLFIFPTTKWHCDKQPPPWR